jgi:hypothetical protein
MTDIDVVSAPIQHVVVNIATGSAVVLQQTQKIIVNPGTTTVKIATVPLQHITVNTSDRTVVVKNIQQHITVSHATSSVSVINAGPIGPTGPPGPSEIDSILTDEGDLITQEGGVPVAISRVELANDPAFQLEIASFISAHVAEVDPHEQYLTAAEADALFLTGAEADALYYPREYRRNLLDNGQPKVNQRVPSGAAQSVAANTTVYTADRWLFANGLAAGSMALSAYGAYPAPFGNTSARHHLILQNGANAKATLVANDYTLWRQSIEGYRLQELNWGTPYAKPVTLTLSIQSQRDQRIIVELIMPGVARCSQPLDVKALPRTYSVTFPPNTMAIPAMDASAQLQLNIWHAAGSTYNSGNPADLGTTWNNAGTQTNRAAGCTNTWAVINQGMNLVEAQLEAGSVATPIEVIPWFEELQRCKRYLRIPIGNEWRGNCLTTTSGGLWATWDQQMRAAPVVTIPAAPYSSWVELPFNAFVSPTSWGSLSSTVTHARIFWTTGTAHAANWVAVGNTSAILLSAEI